MSSGYEWASERCTPAQKAPYVSKVDRLVREALEAQRAAEDATARLQRDRAKAEELNLRIEALTGEPAHVIVHNDVVVGFDVLDLEAILRRAEDAVLEYKGKKAELIARVYGATDTDLLKREIGG